jgi:hypothetical protein
MKKGAGRFAFMSLRSLAYGAIIRLLFDAIKRNM